MTNHNIIDDYFNIRAGQRRRRTADRRFRVLPDAHDLVHFHRRPFHRFVAVTRYLENRNRRPVQVLRRPTGRAARTFFFFSV